MDNALPPKDLLLHTATYTYGNALVRKDAETPLFGGQGKRGKVLP